MIKLFRAIYTTTTAAFKQQNDAYEANLTSLSPSSQQKSAGKLIIPGPTGRGRGASWWPGPARAVAGFSASAFNT